MLFVQSLKLQSFKINATFTAFIRNHKSTLTEISLNEDELPSGSQDTWEGLLARNKRLLNLKDAKFHVYEIKMTEDGSETYA